MKAPLGIFDSGVGGFTILNEVLARYNQLPIIYLGDTARVPYGNKGKDEIRLIAREIAEWFSNQNVEAILVACNTTNSLALDILKEYSGVQVLPLINFSNQTIYESRIGVLATPSTVSSGEYTRKIQIVKPNAYIIEKACPDFVPLIESGRNGTFDNLKKSAEKYLKPLLDNDIEAIVLGCSHYPLIKPLLLDLVPHNVRFIDPAIGLAKSLENFLIPSNTSRSQKPSYSSVRFCVTSNPLDFALKTKHWLEIQPDVELVSLRSNAYVF